MASIVRLDARIEKYELDTRSGRRHYAIRFAMPIGCDASLARGGARELHIMTPSPR
jgi:hypothetical protein